MIYEVSHRTAFRYSQAVSISHHVLHLAPRATPHQACHRSAVKISPTPAVCASGTDYFSNPIMSIAVQDEHTELDIDASSTVDVTPRPIPQARLTSSWNDVRDDAARARTAEAFDACQFAFDSPGTIASAGVAGFARECFADGRPILEAALDLTARIYGEFAYDDAATTVSTPVDEVFAIRRGVCQDFAHLQLACLRALSLPARYVSGYLLTHPPEGVEKLVGADASHAWLSIWCGRDGWIDLDPTNNTIPSGEHITLAWGRDYGDVSPINGVIHGGGSHIVDVAVDVAPAPNIFIVN